MKNSQEKLQDYDNLPGLLYSGPQAAPRHKKFYSSPDKRHLIKPRKELEYSSHSTLHDV